MGNHNSNDQASSQELDRVKSIRARHSQVSEELIRLSAEKESVDRQIQEMEQIMRERYEVQSLDELRELAKRKASQKNQRIVDAENTIASSESIIKEVRKNLKQLDEG